MRQVILDVAGKNGGILILNERMKNAREIAGSCIELDAWQSAQKPVRLLPARRRAAPLWITATFLATTWASETQGFPEAPPAQADSLANTQLAIAASNVDFGGAGGGHDFETVQASRIGDKSALVAQASDTEELEKALEQEQAELFQRLLTLYKLPPESVRLNQMSESDYAELRKSLQQERERAERLEQDLAAARRDVETQMALAAKANDDATQLNKAAESGSAELKRSLQLEHERAGSVAQELSMARTTIYAYEAQARKDSDQATDLIPGDKSGTAELSKSLQQERERAEQLGQDLAASRRDVEMQTALASKASQEASQLKQVAEIGSAELKRSLQQEHDRAETLGQDLSTARTQIDAYEAQARTAGEQAANLKQAAESGAAELRNSLQQERERAAWLERDLAAARRDVETQTALAAKANEEATQLKQIAERGSAELKQSLQKEHDRAEALAQDLSMVHTTIYAYEAQSHNVNDRAAGLKQAEENSAAELRKALVREWERAARLQRELAAARRGVETQTALAAKASAGAARRRQVAENGSAELKRSLQPERDRVARPERELTPERNKQDAPAVTTAGQVTLGKKREAEATRPVAAGQVTVADARGEAQLTPENAAQVARLVARASVLLGQGDVGSARIVLERAAETGSAQASFRLAETYDPLILRKWGTYGTHGDAAKARDLYAQAQAGGIKEATERLDALRH